MKIIFMGRKQCSADLLKWTVEQGIDVDSVVTDSHLAASPTAKIAGSLGIPVVGLSDVETKLSQTDHGIDLVVSNLFWKKIKEPVISGPKYGCINFHPAILPKWRGTAGYNVAILNKLDQWGATAHYVDSGIDTGEIIKQYKFDFDYRIETAKTLEEKTLKIQNDLYKSVLLDVMENGKLESTTQNEEEGIYVSRAEMEAMKQLDLDKDDIDLKIRAFWFPPYDGANIEVNGKKYTLINSFILKSLVDENTTFQL